ncbi:MAG: multidrug efflux pump [Parasphingorhabdus sp.]|jgi:multidrug efflux pump
MALNLVEVTLKNNRLSIVITLAMILWGCIAYVGLPKAEDPGFIIRTVIVKTQMPGASAQRMEELVTSVIEESVMEMPELDNVQSISREGLSYITVRFKESYKEMRPIFDSLRRKIESVTPLLPTGIQGPFVDDEFGDVFGSLFTLTGDGFNLIELANMADDIRDQLIGFDLVSKVELYGKQKEVIYVQYSGARLREMGISPSMLGNAISSVNVISPGGDIVIGEERISLEPSGNFTSLTDLNQTVIRDNQNNLVQLQDIANISRVLEDPATNRVFANGKPAMVLAISMNEGGDILKLGEELRTFASLVQTTLPLGVDLRESAFQADIVELKIQDFISSIAQAIAIVFLVLLIFLGLRTAIAVAILIPMAILSTFALMSVFSISINQVSLAGLIISLGLLVDNGIVINESIMLKMEKGKSGLEAAGLTIGELKIPLLVASLTTVAAFMPIALAESAIGEFCAAIFYIVAIALGSSWVFSITVIPAIASLLLKVKNKGDAQRAPFVLLYTRAIKIILQFRWLTILLVLSLFGTVGIALNYVPAVFIPPSDEAIVSVELDLPLGRDIEVTQLLSDSLQTTYQSIKSKSGLITGWTNFVGSSAPKFKLGYNPGAGNPAHISSIVTVRDAAALDSTIIQLSEYIENNHPDVEYKIARLSQGPPVSYPIQVRLSGQHINDLESRTAIIKKKLLSIPGIQTIKDDWGARTKKIVININQQRALASGVTSDDVADSLRQNLSGFTVSDFREGEDRIPITLITEGAERNDLRRINDLTINSQSGASVKLAQIAEAEVQWSASNILRRDRVRTVTVSATLFQDYTATMINQTFNPWLGEFASELPSGYSIEIGGESESSDDASQSIVDKLPLAFICIVLLLVSQFNSLRKATIIMLTIPMGVIGMAWGLLIAQSTFGFFTILGVLSLAGIIINNAIVLIDSIDSYRDQGLNPWDAVVAASESRLRPILLTTATTCGGMIPLWVGGGMFETMAVTIFFGLLFGSVITLIVVPALYAIFFRVEVPENNHAEKSESAESEDQIPA